MNLKSASAAMGLALVLASSSLSGASAQDSAVPDGQKPPAQAEAAKPEEPKCVTDSSGFKQDGNKAMFVIELQNVCDKRLKCTVDAYIVGARGPMQGHATLVLAAAPKGQTTRKTYAMKVKSAGGMASLSRQCKEI